MVYQGRAEALAPIYLLRRDFKVEGEPAVVAQDANLDVRRFAWSADGTLGAALYADRLVAIDPGEDVRHLSDGIVAITFGDDAGTVYAVRVTSEGGNDVASILAVKQAGRRGARARPGHLPESECQCGGAAGRGPVPRRWRRDSPVLDARRHAAALDPRRRVVGIDPVDGGATALEEHAQPVLWAPEGERRIGFARQWQLDDDPHGRSVR